MHINNQNTQNTQNNGVNSEIVKTNKNKVDPNDFWANQPNDIQKKQDNNFSNEKIKQNSKTKMDEQNQDPDDFFGGFHTHNEVQNQNTQDDDDFFGGFNTKSESKPISIGVDNQSQPTVLNNPNDQTKIPINQQNQPNNSMPDPDDFFGGFTSTPNTNSINTNFVDNTVNNQNSQNSQNSQEVDQFGNKISQIKSSSVTGTKYNNDSKSVPLKNEFGFESFEDFDKKFNREQENNFGNSNGIAKVNQDNAFVSNSNSNSKSGSGLNGFGSMKKKDISFDMPEVNSFRNDPKTAKKFDFTGPSTKVVLKEEVKNNK